MKREIRRDARRYKENKAKLRRQKDMLLKRKNESKESHAEIPVRKLKKLTEGLPQLSRHDIDTENNTAMNRETFSVASFSSPRYNNETYESKGTKSSAFASLSTMCNLSSSSSVSSNTLNSSLPSVESTSRSLSSNQRNSLPSNSLTQSIVNKLPSIGHKFVGDTKELIMKNTIKPIMPVETMNTPNQIVNAIKTTPTQLSQQQEQKEQQQQEQQLIKKPIVSMSTSAIVKKS